MQLAWAGWVAALVPYTVCFVIWQRTGGPIARSFVPTLRFTLFGLALYMGWTSFRWRRRVAGMVQQAPDGISAAVVGLLRSRCLAVWAMSESVAIFGLIVGFFTHDALDFAPLAVASLSLLYIHRPWSAPFDEALQKINQGASRSNACA